MKIYIFRHGIALDRDEALIKKVEDAGRPLTEKGRERNQQMLNWFKQQEISIEAMVVSPYLRAVQTSVQLKDIVKGKTFSGVVELIPSAPPQAFVQWTKAHAKNLTNILVIGHEPQLTCLASWLVSGSQVSNIDLKKSGCICLEVESLLELGPRSAIIKWIIGPKLIAKS